MQVGKDYIQTARQNAYQRRKGVTKRLLLSSLFCSLVTLGFITPHDSEKKEILIQQQSSPSDNFSESEKRSSAYSSRTLEEEAHAVFALEHASGEAIPPWLAKAKELKGLVGFLSGLVTVFQPKEANPEEVAQKIIRISLEEGIDPIYVAAVISTESSFDRDATSHVGARGLMQLMPATAKAMAKSSNISHKSLKLNDPELNITLGIRYLKRLENRYRGNRFKALAAYNWGPGNLSKAHKSGSPYPKSVRNYSNKIIKRRARWDRLFKSAQHRASKSQAEPQRGQMKVAQLNKPISEKS